jgi:outer membrane protein assembly factor BamB
MDAHTGKITDYYEVGDYACSSPVISVDDQLIFIPTYGIAAFSMNPLAPAWNVSGRGSSAYIAQDPKDLSLYLSGGDGQVSRLDGNSGEVLWTVQAGAKDPSGHTGRLVYDSAARVNSRKPVVFLTAQSSLIALDAKSGKTLRFFNYTSYHGVKPGQVQWPVMSASSSAGYIGLPRNDGLIETINAADLTIAWHYDPVTKPNAWAQGMADSLGLVTISSTVITQWDWSTGSQIWTDSTYSATSSCGVAGKLIVCDDESVSGDDTHVWSWGA